MAAAPTTPDEYGGRVVATASSSAHIVRFYDRSEELIALATDYFEAGLSRRDGCIAILRPLHRRALEESLQSRGCDPSQVVMLDADQTLARVMVGETPDRVQFRATLQPALASLAADGRSVRALGEMVDILCRSGNAPGAIALERLWNALSSDVSFSLLCGYCLSSFATEAERDSFVQVCDAHSHVIPASPVADDEHGQMRELSLLQQRALALEAEVRERQRVEEQLRLALRLRDDFLSLASHELRTPLAALHLQAQALANSGNDPRAGRLVRSAERLGQLIEQLLDVTRITTDQLRLDVSEVDLAAVVREVLLHHEEEVERSGCTVALHAERPVVGRWDRIRVGQIVTNLLGNALKYARRLPIEIRVEADDGALLSVRDQGIGIARGDQARIFERFERAASMRNYAGLGLGLWITRKIVEAHGGTISVESDVGRGATFLVRLPLGL